MTLRVLVFAEDVLGMTLARDLYDRAVIERGPPWMADLWSDPALRETQRAWSGLDAAGGYTKWPEVPGLAAQRRVFAHGLGLKGYALVAYKVARLVEKTAPRPDVVVLCADTDGSETKRADLLDGLRRAGLDLPFVLAVAHQESEAWVISGFVSENNAEDAILRELQAEHGFDPTLEPHRLTPKRPTDPHDAKRVCASLFPGGTLSRRAMRCWLDTPLEELERRGARTGLPEYLADVARATSAT